MSTNQLFVTIDYVTLLMLVALFSLTTSCLELNKTGNQTGNQIVNKIVNKVLYNISSQKVVADQNSRIILNNQIRLSVNTFKEEINGSRQLNLKTKHLDSSFKEDKLEIKSNRTVDKTADNTFEYKVEHTIDHIANLTDNNAINDGYDNSTKYQSIDKKSSFKNSTTQIPNANDHLNSRQTQSIPSYKLSPYLISFNLSDNSSIINLEKNDSYHNDNYTSNERHYSTPMSINRAKRSTTANYRLNLDKKTTKLPNYHNPPSTEPISTLSANSLSSSPEYQDNQFILKQASLANDLNNVEITYSLSTDKYTSKDYSPTTFKRFTIDSLDRIDEQFTKRNQFFTSKPNLSLTPFNTFTSSLNSLPLKYDKSDLFETSRSYGDLYSNLYTTTTINRNKKITNLFENTATSLLPLLLFDRHQMAQELNFKFLTNNNQTSTPSPLAIGFSLNSNDQSVFRTPKPHDKTRKTNHKHIQSTKHHNHLGYLDHPKSNQIKQSNEQIESYKLPINDRRFKVTNNLDEFNQLTSTVPNEWLLNSQSVSYLNLDYNHNYDLESNDSFDQPFNDDAFRLSTTVKDDEADDTSKEFHDLIDNTHPSNLQSDRHNSKLGLLTINSINRNMTINSLFSLNASLKYNDSSILSPAIQNVVVTLLGLVILITIIGNTLVCLSPIYFRKLRHPSNYLLISLAVSDLGVALLVMPIALFKELHEDWLLGDLICDIWLGLDIVCCTASILHLCLICIDRYLTITRPFTYAVRRKSSRSWFLISVVWILAIGICLPPLLVLGNEHGTPDKPICGYCNLFGYQLYATLGAFYIPLLVMLILYYKIYEAAKKVIEAEHKSQCNVLPITSTTKSSANQKKYSSFSSTTNSIAKPTNTCPAHNVELTNNQTLKNDLQKSLNNVKKSIDQNNQPIKQSTIDGNNSYSSTPSNCASCGRALEKEQANKANWVISDKENASLLVNQSSNQLINGRQDENGTKDRRTSLTAHKSKESLNELDECRSDLNRSGLKHEDSDSGSYEHDSSPNEHKSKKNRKLKKKSRAPESKTYTNTSQPLLETMKRKDQLNLISLKFIDQSVDNLCEQCHNLISSNDKNNNEDAINDLNALECNLEHNTDRLNLQMPTTINCKLDQNFNYEPRFSPKKELKPTKKSSDQKIKNKKINLTIAHQQISNQPSNRKITNSSLRERKASITLGVIMCAFIFCWLPFFILALIRPFAVELIPDWASSLTLWLGYLNSMLNPLIYVTFHQDFRRAFKYIMLCRCNVMKSSMRKEAYAVQFG